MNRRIPKVAIVTPTYNGAAYLSETMESVQLQTYPNLVHVILDNASTDQTPSIIEQYRDNTVPLEVTRNTKVLPQRENWNTAFSLVSDDVDFVRLLCDDDTITPESIEEMVALAEAHPEIGVVGCLQERYGQVEDFLWPADRQVFESSEAIRAILLGGGMLIAPQTLWRKSVADERSPLFDLEFEGAFDTQAVIDLIRRSGFGFVHKSLAFTRVHDASVTSMLHSDNNAWTRDALLLLLEFGPEVLGDDFEQELRRFRRHYIRRILRWKRDGMADDNIEIHNRALSAAGWRLSPNLIADAMLNKLAVRLGLDTPWDGMPGWQ